MKGSKLLFLFLLLPVLQANAQQANIPYFSILSPLNLSLISEMGDGEYTTASFGGDLTNNIVLGDLKFAEGLDSLLCNGSTTDFTGKIAIVNRGVCEFGQKALNAQNQGALALIIIGYTETPSGMAPGAFGAQVTIPVIMIKASLGAAIRANYNAGETIVASLGEAPGGFKKIEGNIRQDNNENCVVEPTEPSAQGWRVAITNSQGAMLVRNTDANGYYSAYVPPTGAPFTVYAIAANAWQICDNNIVLNGAVGDTTQVDFAAQSQYDCVQLETEISSGIMRRCFDVTFFVQVCNTGTITADAAYVDVTLPEEMEPVSSASLPFSVLSNDVYRFQLGDIPPLECIYLHLTALNDCDSTTLEQTLCYSAHAYPDTSCAQPSALWNGASVQVTAACTGNEVQFTITNVGTAPMSSTNNYIVIQDHVMYMTTPFTLDVGESTIIPVPANGATWRLEAGQEANHPLPGNPSRTVEGCTTTGGFSTGYSLMFPLYDLGNAYDEECKEVIGSYDPNDKQGFPRGFGDKQLIRPNTPIDYLIRFQNTGTDTAFTVVVRDTLPLSLAPMSIRGMNASHPFEFEIKNNNQVSFRFKNILLVDSFTNEPASHGFISFKIDQKADNPFGTFIDNSAGIYFDFNPPVITNIAHHEVGEVITVVPVQSLPDVAQPTVYPNPASPATSVRLVGHNFDQAQWTLIDLNGRTVSGGTVLSNMVQLSGQQLAKGQYLLQIAQKNGQNYAVKIVIAE